MESPAPDPAAHLPSTEAEAEAPTMRAIVHDEYGPLDGLTMRDVPRPTIGDDGVLVRVHAAAVHIGDCFAVHGSPFVMRLMTGLFRPKHGIPGFDLAGRVEAVGRSVTRWKVGDEVFGASPHTCAEYVGAKPDHLAPKPEGLSFEEAAAIPTSALAALHALRDTAKVQAGHRVLINGAAGGVGMFAVQIAKALGAEVTGVCSTNSAEMVRSIGADHVIDYTREDFTQAEARFDLVLDNVENRSLSECRRVLTPRGMLILNSGTGVSGFAMLVRLLKPVLLSPFVRHDLRRYVSMPNHEDLVALGELAEAGKLRPVIDRVYPLHETPQALAYVEAGHAHGKVVVTP